MDKRAWWATVQRVEKSWTQRKPLSMHAHMSAPAPSNRISCAAGNVLNHHSPILQSPTVHWLSSA